MALPPPPLDAPVIPPDPNLDYEFIDGANDLIEDWIDEPNSIAQIAYWIGFIIEGQRDSILEDAFESFTDARLLSVKDIDSMASAFANRTQQAGRIIFGTRRTKLLKAFSHWVDDFYRVSSVPSIVGLSEVSFKFQLHRALARDEVRKNLKSQTKTTADAASPGPLKNEREWKQWEEKFTNYCASHLGANGIPLSYVIRKDDEPAANPDDYPEFIHRTVACAPLTGEYYNADKLTVFNMIVSFTTGQPSGDWVKDTLRAHDGRRSMKALRSHFSGEGNATRNISVADRLYDTLHYKTERSMAFETFLTQSQKMFNIFKTENSEMNDNDKVRFLFKRVQHSALQPAIEALKAQQTAGTVVTYTMAANHLSSAVATLPDYLSRNRNLSGVSTNEGTIENTEGSSAIYNADGSINTGFIPNWRGLPQSDRDIVQSERKRLGLKSTGKGKSHNGKQSAVDSNRLNQLSKQNKKYRRQIKSLKRGKSSTSERDDDKSDNDDDEDTDAGDQFGGRNGRRKSKKNKSA